MKTSSPSLAACGVVILSCIAWIGAVTAVLFYFLELTPQAGWITAGILGFSAVLAASSILYLMGHAVELKNYVDPADRPFFLHWRKFLRAGRRKHA